MNTMRFHACSLATCAGDRFEFVHRFPSGPKRHEIWLNALKNVKMGGPVTYPRICSRHFRPQDYVHAESRSLNRVAVPSLNLRDLSQLDQCKQVKSWRHDDDALEHDYEEEEEPEPEEENTKMLTSYAKKRQHKVVEELRQKRMKIQSINPTKMVHENVSDKDEEVTHEQQQSEDECNEYATLHELESSLLGESNARNEPTHAMPVESLVAQVFEVVDVADIDDGLEEEVDEQDHEDLVSLEMTGNDFAAVEPKTITNVQLIGSDIVVQLPDYDAPLRLDCLWLRDLCRCAQCYDETTQTNFMEFTTQALSTRPVVATLLQDELEVTWSDSHKSTYNVSQLYELQTGTATTYSLAQNQLAWHAKHITYRDDFQPLAYADLISSTAIENSALDRLQRSGILLVSGLSTQTQQRALMIKLLLRRLLPENPAQLLHEKRSDFLPLHQPLPHSNCTFLSESCGLQVLSLAADIAANETANFAAEIVLVDGLQVAQVLRSTARPQYDCLTQYKQPLIYRQRQSEYDLCLASPVIQLAGDDVERVRFAPYKRAPAASANFSKFALAMQKFTKLIQSAQHQWLLPLRHDTLIILDNWRICWQLRSRGIKLAATSANSLDCVYIERKEFLSRLHSLQCDK